MNKFGEMHEHLYKETKQTRLISNIHLLGLEYTSQMESENCANETIQRLEK